MSAGLSTPPTELMLQLLLAEYDKLKDEQLKRISIRDGLVGGTVAALTTAVTLLATRFGAGTLIAIPLACMLLGWVYLTNDRMISSIGRYVRGPLRDQLKPMLDSSETAFSWEDFHRSGELRHRWKAAQLVGDILLFAAPGTVALVAFFLTRPSQGLLVVAGIEVIGLIGLCVAFVYSHRTALK